MKLNFLKSIFVCTLAAGLMASATGNATAGTVIGGQLYSPVNLKLSVGYYDSVGKPKKLNVTSKDILLVLGFAKSDQLASGPGGDIYVIDKNTVMTDLTEAGYLTMNFNQLLYTEKHPNGGEAFSFTESGTLTVDFYSDAGNDENSGLSSQYWFEVSGAYTGSGKVSAVKNNQQTVSENLKSPALHGNGFDIDAFNISENNLAPLPVTGSASVSGGGKVLVAE